MDNVWRDRAARVNEPFENALPAAPRAVHCYVAIMGGLFDVIVLSIEPSHDRTWIRLGDHGLANISETAAELSSQTTVEKPTCSPSASIAMTNLESKIPRAIEIMASSGDLEDNADETEPCVRQGPNVIEVSSQSSIQIQNDSFFRFARDGK